MMRTLLGTLMLAATYCLTLASADPWDIGAGILLGYLVLRGFRGFIFNEPGATPGEVARRVVYLPRLVVATFAEIVRGTIVVARAVLSPHVPEKQGFVSIPIGRRTEDGVIFSGLLLTLSPGSVYIGVDRAADSWVIHSMDTSDEAVVVADAQNFYEKYQRPVLP
jgi:multisubunit Na+/H+ antiporter MnhE subunit